MFEKISKDNAEEIDTYKFKPIILCSPGIGKGYEQTFDAQQNKYKEGETKKTYKNKNGHETALPIN